MDCLFGFCYTFLYTEIMKVIINILFKNAVLLCFVFSAFMLHWLMSAHSVTTMNRGEQIKSGFRFVAQDFTEDAFRFLNLYICHSLWNILTSIRQRHTVSSTHKRNILMMCNICQFCENAKITSGLGQNKLNHCSSSQNNALYVWPGLLIQIVQL